MNNRRLVIDLTPGGQLAAALARAEAAEAERDDVNREIWHGYERMRDERDRLAARVAELEAALVLYAPLPTTEPTQ